MAGCVALFDTMYEPLFRRPLVRLPSAVTSTRCAPTVSVPVGMRVRLLSVQSPSLNEGGGSSTLPASIPGYDAASVVVATGANVVNVHAGDHVAVRTANGTGEYATHVLAPAWGAVPYPAHLAAPSVTSLVLNYMTAPQMLTRAAPIADGSAILVHGAARSGRARGD